MDESKGLLATLFDFGFTDFITTKLVKVLFVIGIVFAAIGSIAFITAGFGSGAGWGVLALLFSPVVFLVYVLLVRVYLEIIIVVFRIAEDVHVIAKSKGEPEVVFETEISSGEPGEGGGYTAPERVDPLDPE